jgi:hypothetical protein
MVYLKVEMMNEVYARNQTWINMFIIHANFLFVINLNV